MKAFGMATLGSDMEVKYLPNGDPIGEVSLAFRLVRKDKASGEYLTQWVKASLYGKRSQTLAQFLTKGSKHAFHLRDLRIEEWTKDGVTRSTMRADIDDVELGGQKQGAAPVPHPAGQRPSSHAPQQGGGSGFDDLDDDVPFAFNMNTVSDTVGAPKGLMRARHGKGMLLLQANKADC